MISWCEQSPAHVYLLILLAHGLCSFQDAAAAAAPLEIQAQLIGAKQGTIALTWRLLMPLLFYFYSGTCRLKIYHVLKWV